MLSSPCHPRSRRTVRQRLLLPLLVLLVALHSGCQTPQSPLPNPPTGPSHGALAPGDVVKLTFPGAPELNQSQKLPADGKISLPFVGEIQASGKSLKQLQVELSGLYKSQLKNTDVLLVLESSTIPVYVSGAVGKPGKILLDRPMTVLEAIMEAGGATNMANLGRVVVIRNANGRHETQTFDLKGTLKGRSAETFELRAYDMVYVPERFF